MTTLTKRFLVDSHLHVYESRTQGQSHKTSYTIDEYGAHAGVAFSRMAGDIQSALKAIDESGFAYAVVANLFYTMPSARGIIEVCPGSAEGDSVQHDRASARDRLVAYNQWACALGHADARLIPFVSLDPWVMSPFEMRSHLLDMLSKFTARGVKLHPIAQRFAADDERMWPVFHTCAEMEVPVLMHSGWSAINNYSEPRRFSHLLEQVPNLKLIVAHLGGASWRDTRELAHAHPGIHFDCSEIIGWTGAPKAPSQRQLAELIRDVGAERVLLGSDFPWYDLDVTAQRVLALPVLADEEKELILGRNAANLLNLQVHTGNE